MAVSAEQQIPQHMRFLAKANACQRERTKQRRELTRAPARIVIPALVDPTPELASYKLGTLLGPSSPSGLACGLIRQVGKYTLAKAMHEVEECHPMGRRGWNSELRLRDLTRVERERLVRALTARAPRAWREAACS